MPTYISIPTEKEATQFDGTNLLPGMDWDMMGAFVITIHGQKTYIAPLDFVVTESDGKHHYPCKPDIFLATHKIKANMNHSEDQISDPSIITAWISVKNQKPPYGEEVFLGTSKGTVAGKLISTDQFGDHYEFYTSNRSYFAGATVFVWMHMPSVLTNKQSG